MPVEIDTIPCNFTGDFKVGDNIAYNFEVLCDLLEHNENGRFNKLIVLQCGSLLEAATSQIIYRAQNFNREGVPNIAEADRQEIAGKKLDKFNNVIEVLRKYGVIDDVSLSVYDDLHKIRRYRNKIHIQDDVGAYDAPRDEDDVFSDALIVWAINETNRVITYLSGNFARPGGADGFVGDLSVPRSVA